MDHFKHTIAIVTGGASGIGRALCEELARHGAVVIVADINAAGAGEVAAAIVAAGGRATAAGVDVSHADDIGKLVDDTAAAHGRLDFIFNNAGVTCIGEVRDLSLEDWRRVIDANLWGVIHGTRAAYRVMLEQGFGHIVNIASAAGLAPVPILVPYTASKHAVVGMSVALRAEAAGLGVKVSVVCPGLVRTAIAAAADYRNISRDARMPDDAMEPAACARAVLRGVARNKAIITVGAASRLCWWLYRLSPRLYERICRKTVAELREKYRE